MLNYLKSLPDNWPCVLLKYHLNVREEKKKKNSTTFKAATSGQKPPTGLGSRGAKNKVLPINISENHWYVHICTCRTHHIDISKIACHGTLTLLVYDLTIVSGGGGGGQGLQAGDHSSRLCFNICTFFSSIFKETLGQCPAVFRSSKLRHDLS